MYTYVICVVNMLSNSGLMNQTNTIIIHTVSAHNFVPCWTS